jgi:putative endonuclease
MNPDKCIVYVLRSDRNPRRHYVGLTSDVRERLDWHNAGQNEHTVRDRPWKVIATIEFAAADAAGQFERYLKTGSGRAFAKRHFP